MQAYGSLYHAKSWDSSDYRGWDARPLPGHLIATYAHYIPGTQDEAARLMDEILTPIPIDLKSLKP